MTINGNDNKPNNVGVLAHFCQPFIAKTPDSYGNLRDGFVRLHKVLRVVGAFRPLRSLTRNNVTEQMFVHVWSKQSTCKCYELHVPVKQPRRRMHARAYFVWYVRKRTHSTARRRIELHVLLRCAALR